MIYLSDTTMHPGLFADGEWDLQAKEVQSWWNVHVSLHLSTDGWVSAVRCEQTAAFLRALLGWDVRATDARVKLGHGDVLYVATVDNPDNPSACDWMMYTVSPCRGDTAHAVSARLF